VERENPYLVLGLPFGASREEAQQAFVRRTKALRAQRNGPALTALTRALQQLDAVQGAPESHLAPYRIPADPTALHGDGPGVFDPPPPPAGGATREQLCDLIRQHARTLDREEL
jgi:hypothetical protein